MERRVGVGWLGFCRYVREGSTMPVVPFLERALGAPALHVPISQATDHMALKVRERLGIWTIGYWLSHSTLVEVEVG